MNPLGSPEKITRRISKRGYVYIGRAYAGKNVKVTITPEIKAGPVIAINTAKGKNNTGGHKDTGGNDANKI